MVTVIEQTTHSEGSGRVQKQKIFLPPDLDAIPDDVTEIHLQYLIPSSEQKEKRTKLTTKTEEKSPTVPLDVPVAMSNQWSDDRSNKWLDEDSSGSHKPSSLLTRDKDIQMKGSAVTMETQEPSKRQRSTSKDSLGQPTETRQHQGATTPQAQQRQQSIFMPFLSGPEEASTTEGKSKTEWESQGTTPAPASSSHAMSTKTQQSQPAENVIHKENREKSLQEQHAIRTKPFVVMRGATMPADREHQVSSHDAKAIKEPEIDTLQVLQPPKEQRALGVEKHTASKGPTPIPFVSTETKHTESAEYQSKGHTVDQKTRSDPSFKPSKASKTIDSDLEARTNARESSGELTALTMDNEVYSEKTPRYSVNHPRAALSYDDSLKSRKPDRIAQTDTTVNAAANTTLSSAAYVEGLGQPYVMHQAYEPLLDDSNRFIVEKERQYNDSKSTSGQMTTFEQDVILQREQDNASPLPSSPIYDVPQTNFDEQKQHVDVRRVLMMPNHPIAEKQSVSKKPVATITTPPHPLYHLGEQESVANLDELDLEAAKFEVRRSSTKETFPRMPFTLLKIFLAVLFFACLIALVATFLLLSRKPIL